MEETIGYEALFSSGEWDSLDLVEDSQAEWEPIGDGPEGPDPDAQHITALYEVSEGFEIECELCGTVATSSCEAEARVIALLHEQVGALPIAGGVTQ